MAGKSAATDGVREVHKKANIYILQIYLKFQQNQLTHLFFGKDEYER
jgi:hypothetical protein